MKENRIILVSRIVSAVFTPFYLPLVGLIALFLFSYLNMMPLVYKLTVLIMVHIFTVLLPSMLIRLYRKSQGWTLWQISIKERRVVPYIISIACYFTCYYIFNIYNFPHFMSSILLAALAIQMICAVVNVWWKVSTHSAAIGGVAGALVAFSFIFAFNPTWWLCLVIILAGMVGTSRMILRQHSLAQVVVGFLIGVAVAFFIIRYF